MKRPERYPHQYALQLRPPDPRRFPQAERSESEIRRDLAGQLKEMAGRFEAWKIK